MTKKFVYLICFCLLILAKQLSGQSFQRTYGSSSGDQGRQIISTFDSSFVVVGSYGTTSGVYLIKVDSLGNSIWQKTYNPPNMLSFHSDYSFKQTPDSGFILAGSIHYAMGGASHINLIKTNSTGDTLWTKQYGSILDYSAISYDVIVTADSGYAIVGTCTSIKNIFILKTDNNGNALWAKNYGGTNDEVGYSIKQTSDNGYITTGYTYSFGEGGWDVYLLKVDSIGNLQWTKTYGGDRYDFANDIEITNDGGFILTGETSGNGIGAIYDNDLFLMKTDSAGNSNWAYTYGGSEDERGTAVKETSDGGFIATGHSYSSGAGQSDVYLIKTDSTGNLLWSGTFGGASTEQGNDIIQQEENYFIAGTTRNFSKGLEDIYIIKTNGIEMDICNQDTAISFQTILPWIQGTGGTENSGFTVQSDIIVTGIGDTSSYDPCNCVPPVANFVVGFTHSCGLFLDYSTWANTWYWDFGDGYTSTEENPDHCFPDGIWNVCLTVSNACGTDTFCEDVYAYIEITEHSKNINQISIAPNPFDNSTTIKFENASNQIFTLSLVNPLGQTTLQINNITGNEIQIARNGLPSGLYYVILENGKKIVGTGKLIVQ